MKVQRDVLKAFFKNILCSDEKKTFTMEGSIIWGRTVTPVLHCISI